MDDAARLRAATHALTHWDLDRPRIEEVSRSENVVFRVETSNGAKFVLRLHRPGYHSYDELVSEQAWTSALRAAGMDVPTPRLTRAGGGYAHVAFGDEMRYAGMLEWVDGDVMWGLIESAADPVSVAARFRALGGLMGRMHNQAAAWVRPEGFTRHALDADGLMGERPFWGRFWEAPALTSRQSREFDALRHRIFQVLRRLETGPDSYSLIHADLHPGNIVVHDEDLHVIDFDDAGFGWHVYDLAVALKNFQERPDFAGLRDALVAGYREVRPLGDATVALLPLFLLIRALATIGWISARPELGHADYLQRMVAYVHRHAATVLDRLEVGG